MHLILTQLKAALLRLFPTNKFRLILIVLVLIAAFISVSELAVAKMFTQIILSEDELTLNQMIFFVSVFFIFFAATRAGHYFQRNYRVNVFASAFGASEETLSRKKENWRWSMAFELSAILGVFAQLVVILVFFILLNWRFGLLNIVIVLIIFQILGIIFKRQLKAQGRFVKKRKRKVYVPHSEKISVRIRSGEKGILLSGLAMLVLFGALIYLSYMGEVSPSNTIVIFLGLRMQTSGLANISKSLMRFARARTHSD